MNIDMILNMASNIPGIKNIMDTHKDKISLAKSIFNSGGFKESSNPVEKGFKAVEKELGMSRDHLTKTLQPFLNNPLFKGAANFIAPGSIKQFDNIINQAKSSSSAQDTGSGSGDSGVPSKYPKKFNF